MTNLPVEHRAGGVVFRRENGKIEFLLVTSNSNRERWVIPAGHVEDGETFLETALREVTEEAGVEAVVVSEIGSLNYVWRRENQKVRIETYLYLMRYLKKVAANPEGRQVGFFDYEQLKNLKMWDESRTILKKAFELLSG